MKKSKHCLIKNHFTNLHLLKRILEVNGKISAIKFHRDLCRNPSLHVSKDFVDKFSEDNNLDYRPPFQF